MLASFHVLHPQLVAPFAPAIELYQLQLLAVLMLMSHVVVQIVHAVYHLYHVACRFHHALHHLIDVVYQFQHVLLHLDLVVYQSRVLLNLFLGLLMQLVVPVAPVLLALFQGDLMQIEILFLRQLQLRQVFLPLFLLQPLEMLLFSWLQPVLYQQMTFYLVTQLVAEQQLLLFLVLQGLIFFELRKNHV